MGTVIIWGLGELAGVFAHGLLRVGKRVVPVRREDNPREVASEVPAPECVLVAVGEADLDGVLAAVPPAWKDRVVLVQNELTPDRWMSSGLVDPTLAVVWFEKKSGRSVKVLQDTKVAGPLGPLVVRALVEVQIGASPVKRSDFVSELAKKNAWILTLNIGGLLVEQRQRSGPVTAGDLLGTHHESIAALARELIEVQARHLEPAMEGPVFDSEALHRAVFDLFRAHPDQLAVGRSAPERLARAVQNARRHDVHAPVLFGMAETRDVEVPSSTS